MTLQTVLVLLSGGALIGYIWLKQGGSTGILSRTMQNAGIPPSTNENTLKVIFTIALLVSTLVTAYMVNCTIRGNCGIIAWLATLGFVVQVLYIAYYV